MFGRLRVHLKAFFMFGWGRWFLLGNIVLLAILIFLYNDLNLFTSYRGYSFERTENIDTTHWLGQPRNLRSYLVVNEASSFNGQVISFTGRDSVILAMNGLVI